MKRFFRSSAGIPIPSSATAKTTWPPSARAESPTDFPPNLSELAAKLTITCWMRAASPTMRPGNAGSTEASIVALVALGSSIFTTFSRTSRGLKGAGATL